jgi:hypothetical protein
LVLQSLLYIMIPGTFESFWRTHSSNSTSVGVVEYMCLFGPPPPPPCYYYKKLGEKMVAIEYKYIPVHFSLRDFVF